MKTSKNKKTLYDKVLQKYIVEYNVDIETARLIYELKSLILAIKTGQSKNESYTQTFSKTYVEHLEKVLNEIHG